MIKLLLLVFHFIKALLFGPWAFLTASGFKLLELYIPFIP